MNIQLRFFASIREKLGTSQEWVVLPDRIQTIDEVRKYLHERGGAWAQALAADQVLRVAYNQEMANFNTRIGDGGEIAFFPPVTGG